MLNGRLRFKVVAMKRNRKSRSKSSTVAGTIVDPTLRSRPKQALSKTLRSTPYKSRAKSPAVKPHVKLPNHWRPSVRGDCLTGRERYYLTVLYSDPGAELPEPGGWALPDGTPVKPDASGSVPDDAMPTDGKPDGKNSRRPCAYFGCKYNLVIDCPTNGEAYLSYAASEEDMMDRIERGAKIVEAGLVADYLNGRLDPVQYPPGAAAVTCALDVADWSRGTGEGTLEAVGVGIDRTRERIRQMEAIALKKIHGAQEYENEDLIEDLREIAREGTAKSSHALTWGHCMSDD